MPLPLLKFLETLQSCSVFTNVRRGRDSGYWLAFSDLNAVGFESRYEVCYNYITLLLQCLCIHAASPLMQCDDDDDDDYYYF